MNIVEIPKIIEHLKTNINITNIVWNNIFFWPPPRDLDISTNIYLILDIITQVPSFYDRSARIEIKVCAKNESITKQALINTISIINDFLCINNNWVINMNWFIINSFIEGWNFIILLDDKERHILIKDYFVNFFKENFIY